MGSKAPSTNASGSIRIAIVGSSGLVGRECLKILESVDRDSVYADVQLELFSSPRSEGKQIRFRNQVLHHKCLNKDSFHGIDIAFFDASDAVSRDWVPLAAQSGAWVVDNSAAFRLHPQVTLGIPEVNRKRIIQQTKRVESPDNLHRVFAGPNCTTIPLVMALAPLHKEYGLERILVSTYQSVSGAGKAELNVFESGDLKESQYVANCVPRIGNEDADSGYTSEESKIREESRKILEVTDVPISATAVRVPVSVGHSESVWFRLWRPVSEMREILGIWERTPGVEYRQGKPPTPRDTVGKDPVYLGRLRADPDDRNAFWVWLVCDNIRKGAALNALQIGEILLGESRNAT